MTKLWGPLGWMTLHSISVIYPDSPSHEEKMILQRFLTLFTETITCHFCKSHFENMMFAYRNKYPDFLDSRLKFFLFVVRCHNTVNKRLDKPRPATVKECMDTLIANTKNFSGIQYRESYINYLIRNWGNERTGQGMIYRQSSLELQKINNEYWNPRDNGIVPFTFEEHDVLELVEESRIRSVAGNFVRIPPGTTVGGFKGGRLKLGTR